MSALPRERSEGQGREGGFTLIELLVVIIILGILSAVVVFAVRGTGDKGQRAAYVADLRTLRAAQEAHCADKGYYAGTDQELVDAKLLSNPSELSEVYAGPGGPCTGGGRPERSAFRVTCDVTKAGSACDAASQPVGGTLIINNGSSAPGVALNPAITSEGGTHSNSEDMFNGLLRYEPDGSIGGDLAQTFTINDAVAAASNPNCAPTTPGAVCDPLTTVATFVLRENVKFHGATAQTPGDGAILTPADVEFSFSKAIFAAHGRTRGMVDAVGVTGAGLTTVVPPEAIQTSPPTAGNGGTVKLNLRHVFLPLKFTLNVTEAPIISEAAYGPCWDNGKLFVAGNACPANVSPVGTGPFRFKSLDGTGIRTVKNPDYFRKDAFGIQLPYFDEVFKRVITGSGRLTLESKDVDVAGIAAADRATVATNPSITLSTPPRGSGGGNCITTISFNTTKRGVGSGTPVNLTVAPPGPYGPDSPHYGQDKPNSNDNAPPHKILGDARVREAIFKSLERTKFWTEIAKSTGRVADAPIHSAFQPNGAYQGAQPLPTFDRDAAKVLLAQAGWSDTTNADGFRRAVNHPNKNNPDPQLAVPDGTKLALEYLASGTDFTAAVKDQLALVGIDVTIVTGNNASVVAPRIFHARTFDMAQISYCNNDEPIFGVRRQYHTDNLIQTNAFTNASGYKSTVMDQLWADVSKAPNVATYQSKYLQIQRLALGLSTPEGVTVTPGSREDLQRIPMVQMLESLSIRGVLSTCTGFNHNNTGLYMEAASCRR